MKTDANASCFDASGEPNLPDWLKRIDHTADTGIVVAASGLDELFARAAWGMFSTITDMNAVRPCERQHIETSAPDREALLVRWLSELNYRHQTDCRLFCQFDASVHEDRSVSASVYGERFDGERHSLHAEIKAVTFHGLRIWTEGTDMLARVIFDV